MTRSITITLSEADIDLIANSLYYANNRLGLPKRNNGKDEDRSMALQIKLRGGLRNGN